MAAPHQATFPGFQFPTTTPVPDEVFDVLMPQLSGAELKVLLYICRRTFGFKKESDSISLHQIAHGITTRDGRVLDGGTGLCIPSVTAAVQSLEEKGIIVREKRQSVEKGCEATIYSLKFAPPLNNLRGGSSKNEEGGLQKFKTQQTVLQQTVLQQTDIVVDVTQDLQNFGITKSAVTKLIQDYPVQYIREKLTIAQRLAASGSALVSQNPAGWLRKAIEEDYAPPRNCQRARHKARGAKDRKAPQVVEQTQNITTEPAQCPQNVATLSRENNTENKESEKTSRAKSDSTRENETTWNKALEQLQADLPREEAEARLSGTTLIEVTDTTARIGVLNPFAIPWLERRLYGQIAKAIKGILGKDLDLQFVVAS
jgi:hypothetical protein